jgi:DSF synthase
VSYIEPSRSFVQELSNAKSRLHARSAILAEVETDRQDPLVPDPPVPEAVPVLDEMTLCLDAKARILWQFMNPSDRPSFTPSLLRDMTAALDFVEARGRDATADRPDIRYLVLGSGMPGIFNLGGDLPHFRTLIEAREREPLLWYARVCAHGQYRRAINLGLPLCTIALVQGDALGGGFEAALAHDVIIAERGASFGLPEILFSMFPGMGAVSFLSRRLDPMRAEKMILSGRIYSAEELFEMGVVDRLAEPGAGVDAVHDFVREVERAPAARFALLKARRLLRPIGLKELVAIAEMWVDAALSLTPQDLRKMTHLARAQDRRWQRIAAARALGPAFPAVAAAAG